MIWSHLLVFSLICIFECQISCEDVTIHRAQCRRDTMFKKLKGHAKLTGSSNSILREVISLAHCIRGCLRMFNCLSINFKRTTTGNESNCELLDIHSTNSSAIVLDEHGWSVYEPVIQASPRCRLIACNPGYSCFDSCSTSTGYTCKEINECESSPCQNDGTCIDEINKYSCTCAPGYTGINCETDINECSSSPCQHGGTCTDYVNRYTCSCDAGYTGTNCQTDINECSSSPCQHRGTCTDNVNSYTCSCAAGYTGTNCQTQVTTKTFTNAGYTGKSGVIQQYQVTASGTYTIKAGGARGGKHVTNYGSYPGTFYGGRGATKQGNFHFSAGDVLNIVVGHRGGDSVEVKGGQSTTASAASLGLPIEDNAGTGGGGGSFVYSSSNVLYIAAGGGGGATAGWNGVDGQSGPSGTAAVGSSSTLGAGGTSGQAGQCCNTGSYHGGVGAGWNSIGGARAGTSHGERGGGLSQNWIGGSAGAMNSGNNGGPAPGAVGGFGGGGGGSEDNGASGGGGGYSGGGSGGSPNAAGGGGGSYCGGSSCSGVTGGNTGSEYGFVTISAL